MKNGAKGGTNGDQDDIEENSSWSCPVCGAGGNGTEYTHTEKVYARKVEEGETVITSAGIVQATPGQYVVKRDDGFQVMEADHFEDYYGVNQDDSKDADETVITPVEKGDVTPKFGDGK